MSCWRGLGGPCPCTTRWWEGGIRPRDTSAALWRTRSPCADPDCTRESMAHEFLKHWVFIKIYGDDVHLYSAGIHSANAHCAFKRWGYTTQKIGKKKIREGRAKATNLKQMMHCFDC